MIVSIIIPVYNEVKYLRELVDRCLRAPIPKEFTDREIIIIDDGSSDGTEKIILSLTAHEKIRSHLSHVNHGKGCALRVGFKICLGDVIIIQDGDLEYDPIDNYMTLLRPFTENPQIQVVYGSRFLNTFWPKGMGIANLIANYILSFTTRILFFQKITDEATGLKAFRKSVLKKFSIHARRFEFCPEFTGKLMKQKIPIVEVPALYNGRLVSDGKKIKISDGFIALFTLFKTKFKRIE